MRSFITAAALLQSFVHLASAQVSNETSSDCPQQGGVHIIVSRASLEPVGYGIIGAVKDSILQRVPGSNAEFTVYPATLADYTTSESDGVVAARALINAYIDKCPGQPLVVLGYSQGAQVTADSLVGQQVRNFPANASISEPLPDSTLARVAGVIMMGNPSAVTEESYHVGNSTNNGLFPRQNVANFDATGLASRTQSYCDAEDPYCAAPGNTLAVHVGYVGEYGVAASNFIIDQLTKWYAANGGAIVPVNSASTSAASASPSSTVSATKTSAASHAATGTASKSAPSASASLSSTPAGPSNTATSSPSTPSSTGAASSLQIAGAGMGAIMAGFFAFM